MFSDTRTKAQKARAFRRFEYLPQGQSAGLGNGWGWQLSSQDSPQGKEALRSGDTAYRARRGEITLRRSLPLSHVYRDRAQTVPPAERCCSAATQPVAKILEYFQSGQPQTL